MLYRNINTAVNAPRCGLAWVTRTFVTVTLSDGRQFVRTYDFNQYTHKCKRCRKAERNRYRLSRYRLPSTGHVCEICGNPYGAFVRQGVRREGKTFHEVRGMWSNTGKLH